MSTVSIIKSKGQNEQAIAEAVRKSIEAIGGLQDIIKPGYKVLINPNLVAPGADRFSGCVTRYEVCKAIADLVAEVGGKPFIAESSAAGVDTEKVIEFAEYTKLREQGYTVLDLKKEEKGKPFANSIRGRRKKELSQIVLFIKYVLRFYPFGLSYSRDGSDTSLSRPGKLPFPER